MKDPNKARYNFMQKLRSRIYREAKAHDLDGVVAAYEEKANAARKS